MANRPSVGGILMLHSCSAYNITAMILTGWYHTLSGNLHILLDWPICANTVMCITRLLSFRMHTAINDKLGSSKWLPLKKQ